MESNPDKAASKGVLLRLPISMHADLKRAAAEEGVSLNTFITALLAGVLPWPALDQRSSRAADTAGSMTGHKEISHGRQEQPTR